MIMREKFINVQNVFGNFASAKELMEHYSAIFGGEDGFFHAWRLLDDVQKFLESFPSGQFRDVELFCQELEKELEG